jgi:hypothetical protein
MNHRHNRRGLGEQSFDYKKKKQLTLSERLLSYLTSENYVLLNLLVKDGKTNG